MPHVVFCCRCSWKYYKQHKKWPSEDRFKAIYRKTIKDSDEGAPEMCKRLAKYWYLTGGGESRFRACEICHRRDPGIADVMEHVPEGWTERSKEEWIADDLAKRCVVM